MTLAAFEQAYSQARAPRQFPLQFRPCGGRPPRPSRPIARAHIWPQKRLPPAGHVRGRAFCEI